MLLQKEGEDSAIKTTNNTILNIGGGSGIGRVLGPEGFAVPVMGLYLTATIAATVGPLPMCRARIDLSPGSVPGRPADASQNGATVPHASVFGHRKQTCDRTLFFLASPQRRISAHGHQDSSGAWQGAASVTIVG
jgi:hypothetical protein